LFRLAFLLVASFARHAAHSARKIQRLSAAISHLQITMGRWVWGSWECRIRCYLHVKVHISYCLTSSLQYLMAHTLVLIHWPKYLPVHWTRRVTSPPKTNGSSMSPPSHVTLHPLSLPMGPSSTSLLRLPSSALPRLLRTRSDRLLLAPRI
jgi:hypothetical protein